MSDLAPYAVSDLHSAGRRVKESAPAGRSEFQRDRDRIVHSTAFRRLEYKTQVFVNHEGDLFRTRLTHSLEVAQIGRSLARNLEINEDLVEAIALAHDLGHTPFGHAGQTALNVCMEPYGGFEHNQQSLRVVDVLEERYAEFDGLNLCLETRAGILKHCTTQKARELGDVAARFLSGQQPSLEAQVVNLADEIAYNNHDVDDGLRAELIHVDDLRRVSVFARHYSEVSVLYPGLSERRTIHETVRRMINTLITDVIAQSMANIRSAGVAHPDDVRSNPPMIRFSREIEQEQHELKRFLHHHLYCHYRVLRMGEKADHVICRLFDAFMGNPGLLPPQYQDKARHNKSRTIADYIAGMTDRYATREYRRLFTIEEF
jgi:dGTPase